MHVLWDYRGIIVRLFYGTLKKRQLQLHIQYAAINSAAGSRIWYSNVRLRKKTGGSLPTLQHLNLILFPFVVYNPSHHFLLLPLCSHHCINAFAVTPLHPHIPNIHTTLSSNLSPVPPCSYDCLAVKALTLGLCSYCIMRQSGNS